MFLRKFSKFTTRLSGLGEWSEWQDLPVVRRTIDLS